MRPSTPSPDPTRLIWQKNSRSKFSCRRTCSRPRSAAASPASTWRPSNAPNRHWPISRSEFSDWISADVAALGETYEAFKASGAKDARDALYRAGHDLRGQALTFEFPLVARVAYSLCKLLDAEDIQVPLALIDAHVNAIRVIVRQNIKDADDKVANTLASELDARVSEFLGDDSKG